MYVNNSFVFIFQNGIVLCTLPNILFFSPLNEWKAAKSTGIDLIHSL